MNDISRYIKVSVILISAILLFACRTKQEKFLELDDGSMYRLIAFTDSTQKLEDDDFMECYLTIVDTVGDTIHYVPQYKYYVECYRKSPIYSALKKIRKGDSIHLRLTENKLYETFGFDPLVENSTKQMELQLRALQFISKDDIGDSLMYNLSKRAKLENKEIRKYISKDIDKDSYLNFDGVYLKYLLKSMDTPIRKGDLVDIAYQGKFLNGYVFDSKTGSNSLEIVYGQQGQIIDGINQILGGLKQGEIVKIILPSHLAFGERGSVKGIVPPYTPLVYQLTIKKVTHNKQNEKKSN